MFSRKLTYKKIPLLLFLIAATLLILSLSGNNLSQDTNKVALKTEKRITKRIEILEKHIEQAVNLPSNSTTIPEMQV